MNEPVMMKVYSPNGIVYKRRSTTRDNMPVKKYWSIGEVAEMLEIEVHVVRYWCEFMDIQMNREKGHHRRFNEEAINKLGLVKEMVNNGIRLWKIKETMKTITSYPEVRKTLNKKS